METIKLYQTSLHLYSVEEWLESKWACRYALYNPTFGEWDIHMPRDQEALDKVCLINCGRPSPSNWEAVLLHEYVHYLQHSKGCWDELVPLGLGGIPMTKAFKKAYSPDHWAIEAEAYWVMHRPHLIGWRHPDI